MTDKIIALVDGSIYSESVCEHAAWIATRTGAPVELIHILGRRDAPETTDLSGSIRLGARSKLLEDLAELDAQRAKLVGHRGRAILDDARAIVEEAGATMSRRACAGATVVETISEVEGEARVIVVGKRGEAADFAKGHLGSNLERIVRTAKRPVFVASRAFSPIERVLVAYDGSRLAMKAVDQIARSSFFAGLVSDGGDGRRGNGGGARGWRMRRPCSRRPGSRRETRLIEGRPEEVLGRLVDGEDFGLLVMGAYGHSRIRSFVIGSTTTEMVRSCKVPVLMLH
jgi:nucleotide-binding universal stress UspA family protein